ncbi:MAG: RsbRD N-terminal domain-containing protein, partial [Ignavibacteriaceae bacterium]
MLKDLLVSRKSAIVNSWIQLIVETYPSKTSGFLKSQKDRFSNPVGYAISNGAEKIFEEIVNQNDIEKVKSSLTDLIKIRAVQNFSPSEATGFI